MIATAAPVDLRERAEEEQVVRLLAIANNAEEPDAAIETARRAGREYRGLESMMLWGVEDTGHVQGIIGIETAEAGLLILRDLAVAPEVRRRGIGRQLIDFVRRELAPQTIRGRTWPEAVEFYKRCGFTLREDGVLASGATRYLFEWRRS